MTEHERLEKLRAIADTLTRKLSAWVDTLDPETAGTQTVRHLCATLKDLKDLSQDLEESQSRCLTVIMEGGEDAWSR